MGECSSSSSDREKLHPLSHFQGGGAGPLYMGLATHDSMSHSIDMARTNYHALAAEATEGLKSRAFSNNVRFNSHVLPLDEDIVIMTDKTKVVQIVNNLLKNAIQFSAGSSVSVKFQLVNSMQESVKKWGQDAACYASTIFTSQEHEVFASVDCVKTMVAAMPQAHVTQKWLLVSVADTGSGMKPEELAEMLRPQEGIAALSNSALQGPALGLFICTFLCRQLNGFMACSSTPMPKGGKVFHVGIPVVGIPEDRSPKNRDDKVKTLRRSLTSDKKRGRDMDHMSVHAHKKPRSP